MQLVRSPHLRRSRRLTAAFAAVLALAAPTPADAQGQVEISCREAGIEAERQWSLPAGLMAAIGQVESGRTDAAGGQVSAWSWTINAAGVGHYFASKAEAIGAVMQLQARGTRSIDVGCFQINMMFHPAAFATLEHAFDPRANALYAAKYLSDLQQRTGSWEGAIGAYHSSTPGLGDAYRARVLAAWSGGAMRNAGAGAALPALASAAPRLPVAASGMVVWSVATQAMGMRVWTVRDPRMPISPASAALPRVFASRR